MAASALVPTGQRIGRFSLELPGPMRRTSQRHAIRRCELEEVVWPEGTAPEHAFEQIWAERIGRVRGPFDERRLDPHRRALVHQDGGELTVELLVATGVALWLRRRANEPADALLGELTAVADRYRVAAIETDALYLEHGAVLLPCGDIERAEVFLEGHPGLVHVRVTTQVMRRVPEQTLLERWAELGRTRTGRAVQRGVETVRAEARQVAGLDGEELVLRYAERGVTETDLRWEYGGRAGSGAAPNLVIEVSSTAELGEALAMWGALLGSVRAWGSDPPVEGA